MRFHDIWLLAFLIFVPLVWYGRAHRSRLLFSCAGLLPASAGTLRTRIAAVLPFLRAAALGCMVIALARPQAPAAHQRPAGEGIDIVLALDVSTSMKALDFTIRNQRFDRLHVVKQVVEDFIRRRVNDRVGMVAFAGRPYVVCPLTIDRAWLGKSLERVKIGMVEDGTAIGAAILAGLNRLRQSTARSKIIILLTDGANNAGNVSPLTAADAAAALGVKIYTVGAGSKGAVPYPVSDMFGNIAYQSVEIDLDEDLLRAIADTTAGQYFLATDTASLQQVYSLIDTLERTPFQQPAAARYEEKFHIFLGAAVALLLLEVALAQTIALRIP